VLAKTPEVVAFTRRTGTELGPATATMQSRGDIMVRLVPRGQRDEIRDIIDRVRDELHGKVPEARFEYVQVLQDVLNDLQGSPAPIEVRVLGDDPRGLEASPRRPVSASRSCPIWSTCSDGREGVSPILDARSVPRPARSPGIDPQSVGADLQIAIAGREVAQILLPSAPSASACATRRHRYDAEALARSPIAYGPRGLPLGRSSRSPGRSPPRCCGATACAPPC